MIGKVPFLTCWLVITGLSQPWLVAQQITFNKDHTTGLKVGEQIPDSFLREELRLMEDEAGDRKSIRLSDFKGKLIILDFWSVGCPSCIAAFPKMEALQNEFPDDVKIFLVNREARSRLDQGDRSFLNRINMPNLSALGPEAYSALSYFFPHRTIPHHVWINGAGKVIAITNGYNSTPNNVKKYLRGELGKLYQKVDHQDRSVLQDKSISEVFAEEGKLATGQYVSWLSPREELFGNVIGKTGDVDSVHKTYRTSHPNYSVIDLLRIAFSEEKYKGMEHFNANARIVMDFPDSARFMRPSSLASYDEWAKEMEYTYEQIIPLADTANRFVYMQQDLNRYFGAMFGLTAKVEERMVTSIVATADEKVLHKIASEHQNKLWENANVEKSTYTQKATVQRRVSSLYYFSADEILKNGALPFVYEVSSNPTLIFNLGAKYSDFEELKVYLEQYGILLSKEQRMVPMLVIEKTK